MLNFNKNAFANGIMGALLGLILVGVVYNIGCAIYGTIYYSGMTAGYSCGLSTQAKIDDSSGSTALPDMSECKK